ncbi:hypothetical protein AQUCO_01300323v1 [Aquilegia coerulea]|uniref:Uncharacterized protein n=1 Tax=Aquilegia coerulea TaxID=218851 RepID=A0A2G5E1L7_AQUCA|nr:hypothetical protein AQUCO_01300323v1 [Aquilegia coerulea]
MENERASETLETERSEDEEEEEGEEEYSEEEELLELKQMADKIRHYRSTIPVRIQNSLTSLLAAQRPILHPSTAQFTQKPGTSADPNPGGNAESSEGALAEVDSETTEKLNLLKHKISNNISAMPTLLKRMKDCISMFEKLETYDVRIHPAFKRKRTS